MKLILRIDAGHPASLPVSCSLVLIINNIA